MLLNSSIDSDRKGQAYGSGDEVQECRAVPVERKRESRPRRESHWLRLQAGELDKAGISPIPDADLRSAGGAVPARRCLHPELAEPGHRNLLVADELSPTEKKIYELPSAEESFLIDSLVETGELNSGEVLATLFTLEIKGIVQQLPGKQFAGYCCKR
jgi:predicted Rossmann fold nucleotide-binding protein DprA/Smf involved in DNA uptake